MIRQATDSLNLHLIRSLLKPLMRLGGMEEDLAFLKDALHPDSDPDELYYYTEFLALAWAFVAMWLGLLCVGIAYLLNRFDGEQGHRMGLAIFLFVVCFCLAGSFDAAWRFYVLAAARRYHRAATRYLDHSNPFVRLVRHNEFTLLLQLAAGAFFAWRFSPVTG